MEAEPVRSGDRKKGKEKEATMLRKLALAAGAAVAVVAVTGVLFSTVLAAGPGPKAGSGDTIGGRDISLAVAADLTGLAEEELLAELEGGTTIPALLEEKGIDLSVFHQAVADARQAALEQAVAEGAITPERAQVMAQNIGQAQMSAGPHGPRDGSGQGLGDCTGDANRYGMSDQDKGYGEPGDGTGPGLSHRYGADSQ
jgi:hypothetical protein